MKYGIMVLKEGTIIDDDFHEERCSQILTQMSGCSIFLNHNMWFKVVEIKTE
jgi:predicted HD phosphohydrolase